VNTLDPQFLPTIAYELEHRVQKQKPEQELINIDKDMFNLLQKLYGFTIDKPNSRSLANVKQQQGKRKRAQKKAVEKLAAKFDFVRERKQECRDYFA
jgi:hypothetical protein